MEVYRLQGVNTTGIWKSPLVRGCAGSAWKISIPSPICYAKIMSHKLVLEIPEDAFEELVRSASRKGQAPERVAVEILANRLTDPVMRLAGCLSMPYADIAKRHDEYIGAGLLPQSDEQ